MDSALVLELPARPGHPRNSEGAFLTLQDGRILFAYSHYLGDSWQDHALAVIAVRESADGGRTWSAEDRILVANEGGCNVMSVSLLRLADGRIALFYLRKNSARDCRPCLRTSAHEGATWSEAACCAPSVGYFVVNNDRIQRLSSGRLIIPAAWHRPKNPADPDDFAIEAHAEGRFFLSDDDGVTWRESQQRLRVSAAVESGLQEPGLIERRDGSLYGWARTSVGQQWEFESRDGGETWSEPRPSRFTSPCSPLSVKNLGSRTEPLWLAVWNDPSALGAAVHQEKTYAESSSWGRTPLVAAFSHDEGASWSQPLVIEDDPARGFCYTAIHRTGDAVLLAYCCGGRGTAVLQDLCIRRLKLHD
ncbi:MAG TPA: sialidase family protein [Opitutaceae bacterium]|nr:sialidase family protein [Opitutaceae bacterium]